MLAHMLRMLRSLARRVAVKQDLLQTERKEGDEWMRQTEQGMQVMGGEKVTQGVSEGGGGMM